MLPAKTALTSADAKKNRTAKTISSATMENVKSIISPIVMLMHVKPRRVPIIKAMSASMAQTAKSADAKKNRTATTISFATMAHAKHASMIRKHASTTCRSFAQAMHGFRKPLATPKMAMPVSMANANAQKTPCAATSMAVRKNASAEHGKNKQNAASMNRASMANANAPMVQNSVPMMVFLRNAKTASGKR